MNGLEVNTIIRKMARSENEKFENTKILLYSCLSNTNDVTDLSS